MDWILQGGAWIRDTLEKGDLYISAEDELLFYEEFLGEKYRFKGIKGCEIEVPGKGYVYLLESKGSKGEKRIGKYIKEKRIFEGKEFSFGFTGPSCPFVLNFLRIKNGPNILDGIKVKVTFSLGNWKMIKTEKDMNGEITGYREGALRTLLRQNSRMEIIKGINILPRERIIEIYEGEIRIPFNIYIPWLLRNRAEILLTIDFNERIDGSTFWTEKVRKRTVIGRSKSEDDFNRSEFPRWFAIKGEIGNLLVIIKEEMEEQKEHPQGEFFYDKNDRELGWRIKENKEIKRGSYRFDIILRINKADEIPSLLEQKIIMKNL